MNKTYQNINNFFEEILQDLKCQSETKSYIISIYGKFKTAECDLSKDSLTLLFAQARNNHNFLIYQNLGDWIFFTNTLAPQSLNNASKDYYDTIARLSYYSCYKILNKQWKLFEELSDNLIYLEQDVKNKLTNHIIV